jgi:hypothetical protein
MEIVDSEMGKVAYLAYESTRFDQFLAHPQVRDFITGFIMIYLLLGAYELLASAIYKVIVKRAQ